MISQVLEKIDQKVTCRAQDLTVKQWIELVALLRPVML